MYPRFVSIWGTFLNVCGCLLLVGCELLQFMNHGNILMLKHPLISYLFSKNSGYTPTLAISMLRLLIIFKDHSWQELKVNHLALIMIIIFGGISRTYKLLILLKCLSGKIVRNCFQLIKIYTKKGDFRTPLPNLFQIFKDFFSHVMGM